MIDKSTQSVIEVVLDHVRQVAKERAVGITIDSSIVELGLDSIERMEIIAATSRTLSICGRTSSGKRPP